VEGRRGKENSGREEFEGVDGPEVGIKSFHLTEITRGKLGKIQDWVGHLFDTPVIF